MDEDIVQSPNKYRETEGINEIKPREFLILHLLEHGLKSKDILKFQKAQQKNKLKYMENMIQQE